MHLSARSRAWKKWLVLSWSFIEVMLFGGIVLGWGSLVFVLKDEGIYANLCQKDIHVVRLSPASKVMNAGACSSNINTTNSSSTSAMVVSISTDGSTTANDTTGDSHACSLQDERFALCFAIASALNLFCSAITGQINYKFGTRTTRIVAFVVFTAGSLMLAFTSVDLSWLIFPGLSMIAIGGLPLMITDVQVSLLFTKSRATIAAGLCGVFDMSAGVQLIVKLVYESGFSRRNMFLVIAGVHTLTLVSTFGFLPKMFISNLEDNETLGIPEDAEQEAEETVSSTETSTTEDIPTIVTEDRTAELGKGNSISHLKCLKQPKFITHCFWFCVLQLKFLYFMGSMNIYLNRILHGNKTDGGTEIFRKAMPAVPPLAIGTILCLLFSVMTIIKSEAVIYPVFICMTVFRSFLYGATFVFISAVFPSQYFGFLMGIIYTVSGIVSVLQYALFFWAESYSDAPVHADILLLVLVLISFCHPSCIWFMCNREERNYRMKRSL